MSYDTKCYELAEYFLDEVAGATPADKNELAKIIQSVCEDACNDVEEREERRKGKP